MIPESDREAPKLASLAPPMRNEPDDPLDPRGDTC
jgi:hypothetical protein